MLNCPDPLLADILADIPADRPAVIAGPTASGKSALALRIAQAQGGIIVNADALQVFDAWPILTAQPSAADRAAVPHALYGHLPHEARYSVGHWLRDLAPHLQGPQRPIIVGGTGLYLTALTEGLAVIPPTPPEVRAAGDAETLHAMLAALDPHSRAGLDQRNRARVQRAWEVLQSTGRGLAEWQRDTPAPLLALADCTAIVLRAERDWLADRIMRRFDAMLAGGAMEEARFELTRWSRAHQSAKAIGAPELIAALRGEMTASEAREAAIIASRQYAKRQRTWFRARMRNWRSLDVSGGA